MDEFDVFMDAMSRNWAIHQIMEYAELDNTRQYILLTPCVSVYRFFSACCSSRGVK